MLHNFYQVMPFLSLHLIHSFIYSLNHSITHNSTMPFILFTLSDCIEEDVRKSQDQLCQDRFEDEQLHQEWNKLVKKQEMDGQERNEVKNAFEREINELQTEDSNLRQRIASEQTKLQEIREQAMKIRTQIQQDSSYITTLIQQREELSSSLKTKQSQQVIHSEECDRLSKWIEEHNEKKQECEQVSNEIGKVRQSIQRTEEDIQVQRESILGELESEIEKRTAENKKLREWIRERKSQMILPEIQEILRENGDELQYCSIQQLETLVHQLTVLRDQRKKQLLHLQQEEKTTLSATTNNKNKIEQLKKEQRVIERELQKAKEENEHSIDLSSDAEMQSVCLSTCMLKIVMDSSIAPCCKRNRK